MTLTMRRRAPGERRVCPGDRPVPATIAWVSDGERAKPRRRRGRRRGRRAAGPGDRDLADTTAERPAAGSAEADSSQGPAQKPQPRPGRRTPDRLRTVHETSAGGLVVDGLEGPPEKQVAVLIGRVDRRGRM